MMRRDRTLRFHPRRTLSQIKTKYRQVLELQAKFSLDTRKNSGEQNSEGENYKKCDEISTLVSSLDPEEGTDDSMMSTPWSKSSIERLRQKLSPVQHHPHTQPANFSSQFKDYVMNQKQDISIKNVKRISDKTECIELCNGQNCSLSQMASFPNAIEMAENYYRQVRSKMLIAIKLVRCLGGCLETTHSVNSLFNELDDGSTKSIKKFKKIGNSSNSSLEPVKADVNKHKTRGKIKKSSVSSHRSLKKAFRKNSSDFDTFPGTEAIKNLVNLGRASLKVKKNSFLPEKEDKSKARSSKILNVDEESETESGNIFNRNGKQANLSTSKGHIHIESQVLKQSKKLEDDFVNDGSETVARLLADMKTMDEHKRFKKRKFSLSGLLTSSSPVNLEKTQSLENAQTFVKSSSPEKKVPPVSPILPVIRLSQMERDAGSAFDALPGRIVEPQKSSLHYSSDRVNLKGIPGHTSVIDHGIYNTQIDDDFKSIQNTRKENHRSGKVSSLLYSPEKLSMSQSISNTGLRRVASLSHLLNDISMGDETSILRLGKNDDGDFGRQNNYRSERETILKSPRLNEVYKDAAKRRSSASDSLVENNKLESVVSKRNVLMKTNILRDRLESKRAEDEVNSCLIS